MLEESLWEARGIQKKKTKLTLRDERIFVSSTMD